MIVYNAEKARVSMKVKELKDCLQRWEGPSVNEG